MLTDITGQDLMSFSLTNSVGPPNFRSVPHPSPQPLALRLATVTASVRSRHGDGMALEWKRSCSNVYKLTYQGAH